MINNFVMTIPSTKNPIAYVRQELMHAAKMDGRHVRELKIAAVCDYFQSDEFTSEYFVTLKGDDILVKRAVDHFEGR